MAVLTPLLKRGSGSFGVRGTYLHKDGTDTSVDGLIDFTQRSLALQKILTDNPADEEYGYDNLVAIYSSSRSMLEFSLGSAPLTSATVKLIGYNDNLTATDADGNSVFQAGYDTPFTGHWPRFGFFLGSPSPNYVQPSPLTYAFATAYEDGPYSTDPDQMYGMMVVNATVLATNTSTPQSLYVIYASEMEGVPDTQGYDKFSTTLFEIKVTSDVTNALKTRPGRKTIRFSKPG